ncbi:MAG: hypothetical protein K9G81_16745 [Rhodobacteraceae bacterium]|nr:hypothetical protein [Paracoccaceae bacterium]
MDILASQCGHPAKQTTKIVTGGPVRCQEAKTLFYGEGVCSVVNPLNKRTGRTVLRNDAMNRFMSVSASRRSKEACVEDRGESLVGQAEVRETGECRAFGGISHRNAIGP